MKSSVIVTLADAGYLDQAKQLFSSVYWNSGWKGDYLLLVHDIPEDKLVWFREKGVILYYSKPISQSFVGKQGHPATVLSKFYVFTSYFKQWKNVVFLDADIIVRASLDNIAHVKGFVAPDATGIRMKDEFLDSYKNLWNEFIKIYSIRGRAFNSGVFAFSTDLIEKNTFDDIVHLFQRFGALNFCGEEGTLNLFFKKKRKFLPIVYNTYPDHIRHNHFTSYDEMEAIIIHFVFSTKPWNLESPFHQEWIENLHKADLIDLSRIQLSKRKWTRWDIGLHVVRLYLKKWFYTKYYTYIRPLYPFIDRKIGQVGIFIKRISPQLYIILTSIKAKIL